MSRWKNSRCEVLPLTQICLECVTNNFDRYNEAFLSSEDYKMQQNLLFLQLAYTPVLMKNLRRKGMIREAYLEFLINENLKELDVGYLIENQCSYRTIIDGIAAVGHVFEKVFLDLDRQANIYEFPFLGTLCRLRRVKVLHIPHHCNDIILQHISTFCNKLIELNIDYSKNITEKGLKLLCKKRKKRPVCLIKVLSMKMVKTLDPAVVTFLLQNMPYLEILEYNYLPFILYSMHEKDFKNNTLKNVKLYNLTKLDFSYALRRARSCVNTYTNVLEVCVEVCPNVTTLTLFLFTTHDLYMIYRFLNLKNLTVVGNHLRFESFYKDLNKIPAREQSPNPKLNGLHELCWQDVEFSTKMVRVYLKEILRNSPNLIKMSFDHCLFKNSGLKAALAEYCKDSTIECLKFSYCDVKLSLLETILQCQSLASLIIDSCKYISPRILSNLQSEAHSSGSFLKITNKTKKDFVYEDNGTFSSFQCCYKDGDSDNYYSDDSEIDDYEIDDYDYSYDSDVYIPGEEDLEIYEATGLVTIGYENGMYIYSRGDRYWDLQNSDSDE